jgi:DNA (cytosine-5)-methyltransferase 1
MKYLSTFSGIGGFELGIQLAYEKLYCCDKIETCCVNTVKQEPSSTKIITQNAKNVLGDISLSGEKRTLNKVSSLEENTTPCDDKGCLKCTVESVPVVENQRKSFSPLNIKTETDTKTEKSTGLGICTNLRSKKKILTNTKSSVTTATMQEGDMVSAPMCVGFSEIDKYATQIYQRHFPEHTNFGDITKIVAEELPDFDLLVGGFPCQAFSIAGKRGGFEDTRGTMFFELARILRAKQPRLFVFENVKGLLSHDGGKSFATIIQTLDELGYDCQWQVLNSKNHGVPQNRERVFIIGHLRGERRPEVFPLGGSDSEDIRKLQYVGQVGDADWAGDGKNLSRNAREGYRVYSDEGLSPALRSQLGGASRGSQIVQINQPKHSNDRIYSTDGLSPILNTMQGGRRQPFIQNPKMMNYKKDYENSVAITATSYKEPPVVNAIRRLTPNECERLQGFPDGWTEGVSDTQRYKTLGNAVTVNVIRDIFIKLTTTPHESK